MEGFAFTPAERTLFAALNQRKIRFMLIGMGAAVLEGAPFATQDIDLWFEDWKSEDVKAAAGDAGGFVISGFGMQPPAFGGQDLDRPDIVLTAHRLEPFEIEYCRAIERDIEGIKLRVLPLDHVIASKRAIRREKDLAQLPALEATQLARSRSRNL